MDDCKLKVCVITPRYTISGVALAQFRFARALARSGYDVDLIVGRVDADLVMPDAPGANVIVLQRQNVAPYFLPFYRYLRLTKPDVVFSAEDHLERCRSARRIAAPLDGKDQWIF